jgi:hypothetical protein
MPVKDEVQDDVARMRSMEIKTTLEKNTTLNFAVWQETGTREAFLMHVTAVLDAIKKHGHLDDYEKAAGQYERAKEAMETTRAGLSPARKRKKIKQGKENDQGRREGGSSEGSSEGSRTGVSCQGSRGCSCHE